MMVLSLLTYFATFSTSLIFSRLYKRNLRNKKISCLMVVLLIIVPPVLLSALRKGIGTDYYGYQEIFYSIKASISLATVFSFYQEPGWVLINLISTNYFVVLLISSLIYSLTVTFAVLRLKSKIGITFPLFVSYMVFYSLSFNGIRQAIAAAFFLLALTFVSKSKLKYIVFVLIAALFHKSAIVCLLLLLLFVFKKMKLSRMLFAIVLLSAAFVVFSGIIISVFERLHLYTKYTDNTEASTSGGIGFLLYILPIASLLIYLTQRYRVKDNFYLFLLFIFLLQVPFQFLGSRIPFADRIAEYGLISQVFLIPYSLKFIKNFKTKGFYLFLYSSWYLFYYIFMFVILKSNGVYPYFS